jgi:hypothetical protein
MKEVNIKEHAGIQEALDKTPMMRRQFGGLWQPITYAGLVALAYAISLLSLGLGIITGFIMLLLFYLSTQYDKYLTSLVNQNRREMAITKYITENIGEFVDTEVVDSKEDLDGTKGDE